MTLKSKGWSSLHDQQNMRAYAKSDENALNRLVTIMFTICNGWSNKSPQHCFISSARRGLQHCNWKYCLVIEMEVNFDRQISDIDLLHKISQIKIIFFIVQELLLSGMHKTCKVPAYFTTVQTLFQPYYRQKSVVWLKF